MRTGDVGMTANIFIKIFMVLTIIAIFVIVGVSVIDNQINVWKQYDTAPACNDTAPACNETLTVGVCRLSNTSWLVCEKPTGFEADEHLRTSAWCKAEVLYDVRT